MKIGKKNSLSLFFLFSLPPQGSGCERRLDVGDQRLEALARLSLLLLLRRMRRRSRSDNGDGSRSVVAAKGSSLCCCLPPPRPLLLLLLPPLLLRFELEGAPGFVEDEASSRRRRSCSRVVTTAAPAAAEILFSLSLLLSASPCCSSDFDLSPGRGPAHAGPHRGPQPRLGRLGPPSRFRQRIQSDVEPLPEFKGLFLAGRRGRRRSRREALVIFRQREHTPEEAGDLGFFCRGEVAQGGRARWEVVGLLLGG